MPEPAHAASGPLSCGQIRPFPMALALIAAGNPPEGMIIQSGEMHGFYDVENRVNLYTEMLKFFGRHIGGTVNTGKVEQVK